MMCQFLSQYRIYAFVKDFIDILLKCFHINIYLKNSFYWESYGSPKGGW